MAKIALIFFLFALVAVCMCARVTREEPAKTELETQFNELLVKAKEFFSEDNVKDLQEKAKAAAAEGLAALQKLSNTVNEQIQQSPKP